MSYSNLNQSSRRRRHRSDSSIAAMFEDDSGNAPETRDDCEERRVSMSRELRRTKRQLFLKSVEQPSNSVNRLRKLMLDLTVDAMDSNTSDQHNDSSSSLYYEHRNRSNSESTTSSESTQNSDYSSD